MKNMLKNKNTRTDFLTYLLVVALFTGFATGAAGAAAGNSSSSHQGACCSFHEPQIINPFPQL
mgnify:CR=1 FL=1